MATEASRAPTCTAAAERPRELRARGRAVWRGGREGPSAGLLAGVASWGHNILIKCVEKIDAALKEKDERAEKAACRELKELMLKNNQLIKARQAAEWGMRSLQGSFGRLKLPLDANDGPGHHRLVRLCCKLHQIRA